MMSAALDMLAFAIHTVCDRPEQLWVDARTAKRARNRLCAHVRAITACLVFPDWNALMQTLIGSKPPAEVEARVTR